MADYGYPSSQLDNPSTALLHGSDPSLALAVSSPKPHRPKQFSFLPSQNEVNKGSGASMGYGGYGPNLTMMQGRYGEPLEDDDEEKRPEEWEGGAYRVGDLRSGINPSSPDGKVRFQTTPDGAAAGGKTFASRTGLYPAPAAAAPPILAPPPRDPPRGGPAVLVNPPGRERAAYPNPWEMAIEVPPPGLGLTGYGYGLTPVEESQRREPLQPHPSEQAQPQTRRAFQLSDPPVTTIHHHIPSESSTTSMSPAPQSLSMSTSLYPPPSDPTREYTDSSTNVFDDRYAAGRGYHQQEYTGSSQASSTYPSQQQHQRDASFANAMQDMHSRHAGGGHGAEPTDASFYTAMESGEESDRGRT